MTSTGNHTVPPSSQTILQRYIDVWNGADLDELDHIIAPDFRRHVSPTGGPANSLDELKAVIADSRAQSPELALELVDVAEFEGRLVCRWISRGTRTEPHGAPAEARQYSLPGITLLRFENGRIAEEWSAGDELGALLRLGFRLEPPEDRRRGGVHQRPF